MAMNKRGLMTEPVPEEEEAPAPEINEEEAETEEAAPEGAPEEEPNVSPEEQAIYDKVVNNAYSLIYDKATLPQIKKSLAGGGDPVEGLANTTAMVMMRLEDSAKEANAPIPPDVLFHAGKEVLEDLVNLAEKAGIHSFEEKELEQATYRALDIYRDARQQSGQLDRKAALRDLSGAMAADQDGALTEIFPELSPLAKKGDKEAEAKEPAEDEE